MSAATKNRSSAICSISSVRCSLFASMLNDRRRAVSTCCSISGRTRYSSAPSRIASIFCSAFSECESTSTRVSGRARRSQRRMCSTSLSLCATSRMIAPGAAPSCNRSRASQPLLAVSNRQPLALLMAESKLSAEVSLLTTRICDDSNE